MMTAEEKRKCKKRVSLKPGAFKSLEWALSDERCGLRRIKYADIPYENIPLGAERLDSNYDELDSYYDYDVLFEELVVYGWVTMNETACYWTNADIIDGTSDMFRGLSCLESIDMSMISTSGIKDMSGMFSDCHDLKTLDLSSFDTSNVSNMMNMFRGCYGLESLDLSALDTSKVTNMSYMFSGCSHLCDINLSALNTSEVTSMKEMFSFCRNLKSLDLSSFDSSKVTNMRNMFRGCENLSSIVLSSLDTSSVKDMSYMFCSCASLTTLDLTAFNTASTWYMSGMFSECSNLKSVDLSSFRGEGVYMDRMFDHCLRLESVDISCFHIDGIQDMTAMFCECMNLKKIRLPSAASGWLFFPPPMDRMFDGCESLESLDLSAFDGQSIREAENLLRNCNSLKDVRYPDEELETTITDGVDIQFS